MMDWQEVLRLAREDGRATPEFLQWLQQLVEKLAELEARLAALEP